MNLTTNYMGLQLQNPIVASPSPLSQTVDQIQALADSGVGAVVLHSLFEEQINHEENRKASILENYAESFLESLSYFPQTPLDSPGPLPYLRTLELICSKIDTPIIASLNGSTLGSWVAYAKNMQDAGASGIELNLYQPISDLEMAGTDIEQLHFDIFRSVKKEVSIPVAVKLSPMYTSLSNVIKRFDSLGVDALVLFNRYLYPDIDLNMLEVLPTINLSDKREVRLPLAVIALVRNQIKAHIAATTGVESVDEIIKYLLVGANTVMTTSAILRNGLGYVTKLLDDLSAWLQSRGCNNLDDIRGTLSYPLGSRHDYYRFGYVETLQKANQNPYDWND
ncbi:MAG: dihydroorotate dehydrogenase-like protein [Firmicutes bacterium]|jgi:dihydroorotate dehydrogenase (fumarate)|nr:dihydroorotate dehydrogenase-like protein [Bacillota bacterium]